MAGQCLRSKLIFSFLEMASAPRGCFQKENGTGKEGHSMSACRCHPCINSARLIECLLCVGTLAASWKLNEQYSVLALEILTCWLEKNTYKQLQQSMEEL